MTVALLCVPEDCWENDFFSFIADPLELAISVLQQNLTDLSIIYASKESRDGAKVVSSESVHTDASANGMMEQLQDVVARFNVLVLISHRVFSRLHAVTAQRNAFLRVVYRVQVF